MSSRLEAFNSIKTECRRCRRDKPHAFVLTHYEPVQWGEADFPAVARPPEHETVCRDCLSADEVAELLSPVTIFCLSVLLAQMDSSKDKEMLQSVAHVKAFLEFRSGKPLGASNVEFALRALEGLMNVPIPEIDMQGLYTELSKAIGEKMFIAAHPDDVPSSIEALRAFRDKVSIWFSHDPTASHALRSAIADCVELFKKYFTRRTV